MKFFVKMSYFWKKVENFSKISRNVINVDFGYESIMKCARKQEFFINLNVVTRMRRVRFYFPRPRPIITYENLLSYPRFFLFLMDDFSLDMKDPA